MSISEILAITGFALSKGKPGKRGLVRITKPHELPPSVLTPRKTNMREMRATCYAGFNEDPRRIETFLKKLRCRFKARRAYRSEILEVLRELHPGYKKGVPLPMFVERAAKRVLTVLQRPKKNAFQLIEGGTDEDPMLRF